MDTEMTCYESFAEVTEDFYCSAVDVLKILVLRLHDYHCLLYTSGTDGATLSWMGLPCPNLGTGGFNFHGVCECTTVERMDKATEILLNIVEIYSK